MSDRPFLQLNMKIGETLVNAYADDHEEFDAAVDVLGDRLVRIAEVTAAAQAAATAAGILRVAPPPSRGSTAPQGAAQGQQDGPPAPSCEHGPRLFKSGHSQKTGRDWRAWDCPDGICDRKWVR